MFLLSQQKLLKQQKNKMRIGKLPEPALKRAVLKEIKNKEHFLIKASGCYTDAGELKLPEGTSVVLSTDPVSGAIDEIADYGIATSINNLVVSGATPVGVMISVLLPDRVSESRLRQMMKNVQEICDREEILIIGGHTQIIKDIREPILNVTGVGYRKNSSGENKTNLGNARDLVATKWIGLEGTARIARARRDELKGRYSDSLLDEAGSFKNLISVRREADIAWENGACLLHDCSEGGIFAALWELAETAGCGMSVDLKKIPIRQETVEVSEFFDINPYQLKSTGCLLIVCDNGTEMVKKLEENGIWATQIGELTKGNDRIIHSGEEVRFLDLPQADEMYKII